MKNKFCGNCNFLSLTEENQRKYKLNKENHYCYFYKKRIFHNQYEDLPRLEECLKSNNHYELSNYEKIYGIILSKSAKQILDKLSEDQKKFYDEIIEQLLIEENKR